MALDLSSKPVGGSLGSVGSKSAGSPGPSLSSEDEGGSLTERTGSVFETVGGRDSVSPPRESGLVRPVSGPMPAAYMPPNKAAGAHGGRGSSMDSPGPLAPATPPVAAPPASSRPFKMYPFEPLPSMYSQLAASAAASLPGAGGLYSPYSPGNGSLGALTDPVLSLSSPIAQYLQQKRRRQEARLSSFEGAPGSAAGGGSEASSMPASPRSPVGGEAPTSRSPAAEPRYDHDQAGDAKRPRLGEAPGSLSPSPGAHLDMGGPEDGHGDLSYWDRRRKNNEAAKRSRDARRAKEEEIALRAAFLEQENLKLRAQVAILKNETAKLHYMLYNRL